MPAIKQPHLPEGENRMYAANWASPLGKRQVSAQEVGDGCIPNLNAACNYLP